MTDQLLKVNPHMWNYDPDDFHGENDPAHPYWAAAMDEIAEKYPGAELLHERGDGMNFRLGLPEGMTLEEHRQAVASSKGIMDRYGFAAWNIYDYHGEDNEYHISGQNPFGTSEEQKKSEASHNLWKRTRTAAQNGDVDQFVALYKELWPPGVCSADDRYEPLLDAFEDDDAAMRAAELLDNPKYDRGATIRYPDWLEYMKVKRQEQQVEDGRKFSLVMAEINAQYPGITGRWAGGARWEFTMLPEMSIEQRQAVLDIAKAALRRQGYEHAGTYEPWNGSNEGALSGRIAD